MTVHRIPLPTPFRTGLANAYLVEGDPVTLVDCGVRTEASWQALVTGLQGLGYTPRDLEQVAITHYHVDHSGWADRLAGIMGQGVVVPSDEIDFFRDYDGEHRRRIDHVLKLSRSLGMPEAVVDSSRQQMERNLPYGGPALVGRAVDDGDRIRMGGRAWQVLSLPGHSRGHVAFHQPDTGELLGGDVLLPEISSNPLLEAAPRSGGDRPRSLVTYLASLRRLAGLEISTVYPGHGSPFGDHRSLIRERIALHQKRKERIARLVESGVRTVHELGTALFAKHFASEGFLVISEVVGHLDLLEMEGRLRLGPILGPATGEPG